MLQEEASLYQSPLSHQSVSSFGSPSPTQVTPNTPLMGQQPPDSRNALLTSIAKGQFHLRKMSHSFEPKGMSLLGICTFNAVTMHNSFIVKWILAEQNTQTMDLCGTVTCLTDVLCFSILAILQANMECCCREETSN